MGLWLLQSDEIEVAEQAAAAARETTLQAAQYTAIASITAALLGALLGAIATYLVSEIRDRRSRRAELNGLIRLLDLETEHNEQRMNFQLESQYLKVPDSYAPRTTEWDKAHIRLAQLLEDEKLFEDLATYYEEARTLNEYAYRGGVNAASYISNEQLPQLKELSDQIRPRLQEFRAAPSCPWWGRWFGSKGRGNGENKA